MNNDQNQLVTPDQVVVQAPPLALPINEATILQTLDFAEQRGRTARAKFDIDRRSQTNIDFWKGNQVDKTRLDARYQEAHIDNVIRQNLENKIKLATGHIPDIFASPPDKQDFNLEAARDIQAYLRDRLSSSTNKRLLKNGLRKLDLEFSGIIKCRYDKTYKRSIYELIDSKNVLFGEGAKVYEDGFTIDGTDVLFHYVEEPTQQVLNKFPDKAQELMNALMATGKEIPSRIIYTEACFSWYDREGHCNQGVAWRYGTVILGSMKHPYYDWDNPQNNFFDRPRKNYILFSYSNLGESVYETTTDFEQGIPINRIVNRRRRQITEIADRSVPKLAFLGGSMTKELAASMSSSPNEAIILSDEFTGEDINKALSIIPATPPNPVLYNDLLDLRGRLNSMFAVQGATNVEVGASAGESGISKQITREGDLVTSDDIVTVTLERVIYEMGCWEMQFERLFHDDDRPPLRITNTEGETEYVDLDRQKIETDIQVVVVASSNDKQVRRADALQMLNAKAIDPYTLMEDLDVQNPRERTRRLYAFIQAQQTGNYEPYMKLIGVDPETPFATEDDAERDVDILRSGQQVQLRMPGEKYVNYFLSLVNSPDFHEPSQFDEAARYMVMNHVKRLKAMVDEQVAKQQAEAGVNSQAMGAVTPPQQGGPDTAGAFTPPPQQSPLAAAVGSTLTQRAQQ